MKKKSKIMKSKIAGIDTHTSWLSVCEIDGKNFLSIDEKLAKNGGNYLIPGYGNSGNRNSGDQLIELSKKNLEIMLLFLHELYFKMIDD